MYNLLIVDDEKWIREGLKNTIDWSSLKISTVTLAENGFDALERLSEKKYHIVLSDIVMPKMTGNQLVKQAIKLYPEIKFIMISGFNKFEFVRDSLKFGAVDYLLKPIDEDKLKESIKNVIYSFAYTKKLNKFYPIEKEKQQAFINFKANPSLSAKSELIRNLSLKNENDIYHQIVFIYSKTNLSDQDLINYIEAYKEKKIISSNYIQISNMVFLFLSSSYDNIDIIKDVNKNQNKFICYTNWNTNLNLLFNNLEELNKTIANQFDFSIGKLESLTKFKNNQNEKLYNCNILCKNYIQELYEKGIEWGKSNYFKFVDTIINQKPQLGKKEIGALSLQFMLEILELFKLKSTIEQNNDILSWTFSIDDCNSLIEGFNKFFLFLADELRNDKEANKSKIIRDAITFIETNYSNKNMSITLISDYLMISNSYFSYLFNKVINQSFSKYLTEIRMKHAINLLRNTNLRIYDIATEVGYSDVKYFIKSFKKHTGVSPKLYRDTN